jgi:hypothetical protein
VSKKRSFGTALLEVPLAEDSEASCLFVDSNGDVAQRLSFSQIADDKPHQATRQESPANKENTAPKFATEPADVGVVQGRQRYTGTYSSVVAFSGVTAEGEYDAERAEANTQAFDVCVRRTTRTGC